jgi:hypothetical protein
VAYVTVLLVGLILTQSASLPLRDMPCTIQTLACELQGKSPLQIGKFLYEQLGEPQNVGSGLWIPAWDVGGGMLILHPITGPWFRREGDQVHLLRTNNEVAECLFGAYDLTTMPDTAHFGNCYALGTLKLFSSGGYKYEDFRRYTGRGANAGRDFFVLHPDGTAGVQYPDTVTGATRLEDLADGAMVASVTFSSRGTDSTLTLQFVSSSSAMNIFSETRKPIPFRLYKGWVHYWN